MKFIKSITVISALCAAGGCIQLKTESEIKPIHITMDVNLKVDKELDRAFADETAGRAQGEFAGIKCILERGAAGFTREAMLEPRDGATDDDRIAIAEANARRLKRFNEVAKSSGTSLDAVRRRRAAQLRERIPAGTWYQDDSGVWIKK